MMPRLAKQHARTTTSSFTAFALAPGVLNTTMPASAQAIERDVVHARAGARDGEQVFGQLHVVHGGAAHEDALRAGDVVGEFVIGAEQVGSLGGDVVQAMDVVHDTPFGIRAAGRVRRVAERAEGLRRWAVPAASCA